MKTKVRRSPNGGLRKQIQASIAQRQLALQNGGEGLVPVCCETCGRPIATTAVDRARGEPPILLDFPGYAKGWTCTECAP